MKTDVSNDTNICNEKHYTPQELAEFTIFAHIL